MRIGAGKRPWSSCRNDLTIDNRPEHCAGTARVAACSHGQKVRHVPASWRVVANRTKPSGRIIMFEIGVFHNGASSLPVVVTKDGIAVNDGSLTEVHAA